VIYEMLAGRPPFSDAGPEQLLDAGVRREAPPLREIVQVPQAVDDLVMRCLRTDPDLRFQTMREVADQLELLVSSGEAEIISTLVPAALNKVVRDDDQMRDSTLIQALGLAGRRAALAPPPTPAPSEDKTEFTGALPIPEQTIIGRRGPRSTLAARLFVPPDREVVLATDRQTVIGRDPSNAVFIDDPQVSRHHARILTQDGEYWLEELNSKNGTRVNGAPIDKIKLADNDTIEVGDTPLRFTVESTE
jgi:hypothetical protein